MSIQLYYHLPFVYTLKAFSWLCRKFYLFLRARTFFRLLLRQAFILVTSDHIYIVLVWKFCNKKCDKKASHAESLIIGALSTPIHIKHRSALPSAHIIICVDNNCKFDQNKAVRSSSLSIVPERLARLLTLLLMLSSVFADDYCCRFSSCLRLEQQADYVLLSFPQPYEFDRMLHRPNADDSSAALSMPSFEWHYSRAASRIITSNRIIHDVFACVCAAHPWRHGVPIRRRGQPLSL